MSDPRVQNTQQRASNAPHVLGNYLCINALNVHPSSRGLAVMHSTQTNMDLGSRPNAGHWWRQEGNPALNARARAKVLSEAPSRPQGTGGNGGENQEILMFTRYLRHPTEFCGPLLLNKVSKGSLISRNVFRMLPKRKYSPISRLCEK